MSERIVKCHGGTFSLSSYPGIKFFFYDWDESSSRRKSVGFRILLDKRDEIKN